MKRARVYKRGPRLYLHAVSRTPAALWVMALPVAAFTTDAAESFIGESLADALAASRTGARDANALVKQTLLAKARAKTWSSFARGILVCDVERDGHGVRFFPARSVLRRPFVPEVPPRVVLVGPLTPIHLAGGLAEAFRSIQPRRKSRGTRSSAA